MRLGAGSALKVRKDVDSGMDVKATGDDKPWIRPVLYIGIPLADQVESGPSAGHFLFATIPIFAKQSGSLRVGASTTLKVKEDVDSGMD